jgi:hypothetical protein
MKIEKENPVLEGLGNLEAPGISAAATPRSGALDRAGRPKLFRRRS